MTSERSTADSDREISVEGGEPARERKLRAQGKKTLRKLLDAGMTTFDRKGYHETTVDDVVTEAQTSRGTFYLYFSNKDDLLNALALDVANDSKELVGGLAEVTPDAAGYEKLRDWLDRFTDFYQHYGPVIRAWQEAETSPAFAELGISVLTDFTEALLAHTSAGFEGAQINPHIASLAFVSMLERFNYLLASRRVKLDRDEMLDTLAQIIHAGFFGAHLNR